MTSDGAPMLAARRLSKRFGSTRALDDVTLEVAPSEVHALLGQNGSGKSTLIKVLSGYHAPDEGAIDVRGRPLPLPPSADDARRLGISFVHQDLGLVDSLSVLDNLRVGRYETGLGGRIRWRDERRRARALLRDFELALDPDVRVGRLAQTEKAIVAIVRALQDLEQWAGGGLLVLDEPTASLPEDEVRRLFAAVEHAKERGSSVLFVTHRLDEVLAISDRVSVLRDGRLVATRPTSELDHASLVTLILGRELGELYPPVEHRPAATVLEVRGLAGSVVRDLSLALREGEVLGLTGLVGAGHDELPYLVSGARRAQAGEVVLRGRSLGLPSPAEAAAAGIGFLPGDRQRLAGIPRARVRENVTVAGLTRYRGRFGLDARRERRDAAATLERLQVHPRDPERRLAELSGGNQQKALLGRWLQVRPAVLLLDEPTHGVDVGSRQAIFGILEQAAEAGTSILYASAEYDDLAHLCDRVLVFHRGRVVRELSGAALTADAVAAACYHVPDAGGAPVDSADPG
ncbi:MAG: sugar ABC transporter ATP-binding protein [Thermoleophilia bacterium]|nr:sugar ABC transporter ATP-binding protein [Thermoleophilia bacterium]